MEAKGRVVSATASRLIWILASLAFLSPTILYARTVAANAQPAMALTPPMGFNNWARFQCQAQAPLDGRDRRSYSFQSFMLDQGRAMVDTGLAAAGIARSSSTIAGWSEAPMANCMASPGGAHTAAPASSPASTRTSAPMWLPSTRCACVPDCTIPPEPRSVSGSRPARLDTSKPMPCASRDEAWIS